MQKNLVIHIGLHKTGTTAVQKFLASQRELLLQHGVLYPTAGTFNDQHALFPGCFLRKHPFLDKVKRSFDLDDYLTPFRDEVRTECCSLCIISSEVFTELITKNNAACTNLINQLGLGFDSTTLLMSTRNDKSASLSGLKHMMRVGRSLPLTSPDKAYKRISDRIILRKTKWRDSGFSLVEKAMGDSEGHLVTHYFDEIFTQFAPSLLSKLGTVLQHDAQKYNSDKFPAYVYLLAFLLALGRSNFFSRSNLTMQNLNTICTLQSNKELLTHSIKSIHLLEFLDIFSYQKRPDSTLPITLGWDQLQQALCSSGVAADASEALRDYMLEIYRSYNM
jgi:hypothetical protein